MEASIIVACEGVPRVAVEAADRRKQDHPDFIKGFDVGAFDGIAMMLPLRVPRSAQSR